MDDRWQLWLMQTAKAANKTKKSVAGWCLLLAARQCQCIRTKILKLWYLQLIQATRLNNILGVTKVTYKWQSYCTCILIIVSYWTAKWQPLLSCGFLGNHCGLKIIVCFIIYALLVFFSQVGIQQQIYCYQSKTCPALEQESKTWKTTAAQWFRSATKCTGGESGHTSG